MSLRIIPFFLEFLELPDESFDLVNFFFFGGISRFAVSV